MWMTPLPLCLVQSKRMENLNLNKDFKVTAFYSLPKLHTAALIFYNTSTILHSTPCPPRRDVFEIYGFHTLHEAFIHTPYINNFNMSMQLCNEECTGISAGKLISDTDYTMKVSFWPDFTFNWLDKNNPSYSWFLRFLNCGLSVYLQIIIEISQNWLLQQNSV